jgi:GTPase-activating protein SAC7
MLSIFASNDEVNLMSASNLAAVFTPGMLSHPSHDLDPVQYKISQRVVEFLIEFHMCFHMPHATALHKDPVMHPSAAQIILPPQPNTPQEVVLNETEKLKNKTSSGTLGSQRSAKTITQQNIAPAISPSASFVTADQLSMSIAPSFISIEDEPLTPRSEAIGQTGSAASSPKPTSSPNGVKNITPKASPVNLPISSNGEREMSSVPELEEGIDETAANVRGHDYTGKWMIINLRCYVT